MTEEYMFSFELLTSSLVITTFLVADKTIFYKSLVKITIHFIFVIITPFIVHINRKLINLLKTRVFNIHY